MVEIGDLHLNYIKNYLLPEIVQNLQNETFENYQIEHSGGLDGFMSALYTINMTTKTMDGLNTRLLIAKFMKGDVAFREKSKSYIQFANEVFIYAKVLPEYSKILKELNITAISINDWIAPTYAAKFGYIEGLSANANERESILVLENLKPHGYTLGPRLYLNRDHLLHMCKLIGTYHAFSYFLRLRNPPELERLKSGIVPLPFINDDDPHDVETNFYRVLYRVGFDRFFDFFDRKIESLTCAKQSADDLKLIEQLKLLRVKYFSEPVRLLEHLRTSVEEHEEDSRFAAILHGDYNRNNVLFQYQTDAKHEPNNAETVAEVKDIKMIDFQELRYGTPAIDLSFFMYMNSSDETRCSSWSDMLKEYHSNMFATLSTLLKAQSKNENDLKQIEQELEKYSFAHFSAHFERYAFYGVMICIHFLPWMLCSEAECERLSKLFETDMHGADFHKLSIEAGGDEVNVKIFSIIRHACKMGYMDHI